MRAVELQTERRFDKIDYSPLGIELFDRLNDYPQRVLSLSRESGSLAACLGIYKKFVKGAGIGLAGLAKMGKNSVLSEVFSECVSDLCTFGGFALYCRFNAANEVASLEHVPYEYVRICSSESGEAKMFAINEHWLGSGKKRATKTNTMYVHCYNPSEHDVNSDLGQLIYVGLGGWNKYQLPIYDSRLTDAATEVAVSDVKYRNAANNFLPTTAIVIPESAARGGGMDFDSNISEIQKMVGAKNACKTLVFTQGANDMPFEVKPIESNNYDQAYINTERTIQENIGKIFYQPPILRCDNVSVGFATNQMEEAYRFYNSNTKEERSLLEMVFNDALRALGIEIKIEELRYL